MVQRVWDKSRVRNKTLCWLRNVLSTIRRRQDKNILQSERCRGEVKTSQGRIKMHQGRLKAMGRN